MSTGIGISLQIGASGVQWGGGLIFRLRDDFLTGEAAPLASPRPAEPGPGMLTITDTNNKLSVASGKLTFATGGVGAGNPGVWGPLMERLVGRAVIANSNKSAGGLEVGWDTNQAGASVDSFRNSAGSPSLILDNSAAISGETPANSTGYMVAIVMRSAGNFYFVKGGVFTNWTLVWIGVASTGSRHAAAVVNGTVTVGTVDFLRVVDLGAPFNSDTGLAAQRLAGSVAAGTTAIHEGNHTGEATITTRPSAGQVEMRFRIQDANNYWQWTVDSAGTIDLDEVVAGTPTQRATSAAGLTSGHRVVWVADASTIRVYSNNVLRFTYSSASNFATETDAELETLGTGGAVSDVILWPRQLSGSAAALLDLAIA